ncbi:MAG: PilC/PilY family type IV pilus protein, partial [Acidobacteriota bacterium]
RPLTLSPPSTDDPNHLWDGAVQMLAQAPSPGAANLQLGDGVTERRILYAAERIPGDDTYGSWAANRQTFDRTGVDPAPDPGEVEEGETDFWTGLELPYDLSDSDSIDETRARANRIVEETVYEKTNPAVAEDPDALDPYILGETFHSDPLILGSPTNTQYFVSDAEETFDGDGDELGTGYQEFFNRHENRRKVVVAGSNDGQVHAFDAGKAALVTFVDEFGIERQEVEFDNGSGREIFAYMPRAVLPTVKAIAENPEAHRWAVDGSIAGGDVFIDPLHDGTPAAGDREWRTVLIGGLREGGSGYYALDVTQPDTLTEDFVGPTGDADAQRDVLIPDLGIADPESANVGVSVPECYDTTGDGDLGCDANLQYPAPLWEFSDRIWFPAGDPDGEYIPLDEDGNGFVDLGETWSVPDIGRIRVVDRSGNTVNKYVAIFGGGLDPAKSGARGNFLYMVDVETGETLYKRQLVGSAVADPAAVDVDQDGFYDRIYQGTTAGLLYRVDLNTIDNSGNVVLPELVTETVRGIDGFGYQAVRIEKGADPDDPLWGPQAIFDTGGRPLYFPPAVLFVADLGEYALAFGTGDRDDLTSITGPTGRFYVFVDESHLIDEADLPMVESRFEEITIGEGDNSNLLTDPNIDTGERGWYLILLQDERLIGNPFGFSGITFFSTYITNTPEPDCDVTQKSCENPLCSLDGNSRIYVLGTVDADAFLETDSGTSRFAEVEGQFVTSPFTEQALTDNPIGSGGDGDEDPTPADPLDEAEQRLMEKLIELFPEECKFGNHRIDVKVIADNTEIQRIAAVPICIVEKNWKELNQ